MKNEIDNIKQKITSAEQDYKRIEKVWLSAKEITSRIESLLHIARELRSYEELLNKQRIC